MECNYTRIGEQIELILVKDLGHPPEKVWRVLTERELLQQWFPCDVIGQWQVGASLQFAFPDGQHEGLTEEELRGQVLVVDPPHRLEFTWGKYRYCCELSPTDAGCRLRFVESRADPSEGARSAAGWEMCFENVDALLQGAQVASFAWEVWKTKFETYVKRFEPGLGKQLGAPDSGSS